MADILVQINQSQLNKLMSNDGPVAIWLDGVCQMVEGVSKRVCPVDTGRLRSSIASEVRRGPEGPEGIIGTNVEYAPSVELGSLHTRKDGSTYEIAAQPFLVPGLYSVLQSL